MRSWLFTCYLVAGTTIGYGQTEPIETDRPDQTETPAIVPLKHFQLESGFNLESFDKQFSYVHPTLLWKAGILRSTEVRLITELITSQDSSGRWRTGLAPVQLGFKTAICEEKKGRPRISFIGHIAVPPFSSKSQRTKYVAPNFRFVLDHTLTDKISLGYNLGMEWDGISPQPAFIYTIANGYDLSGKWYFYYEFFGDFPVGERSNHAFDLGLAWLIRNHIQADVSGGFQLYPFVKSWYMALGLSIRLPR